MKKRATKARKGPKVRRTAFTVLLAAAVAVAALLMFGGDGIRWFGQKSEVLGESVREHSEELGDKADKLRDDMQDKAGELKEDAEKKAGELRKDVAKKVGGDS